MIRVLLSLLLLEVCSGTGLMYENLFDGINSGLEKNITLAPTVYNATFLQKLDHFEPSDTRTWYQLYSGEKSYYKKGGPAYLWIEGEYELNPNWLEFGYWQDHGRRKNAMFFVLEHRFYGKSQPLGSAKTEHLKYLTTNQALADIASFILSMNKELELPEKTKWIVFGGSYGGNLAAWMRLIYPHLVHGAVASSAPVLAKADFPEYYDTVGSALASYTEQCQMDIALANNRIDEMVQTKEGRKEFKNLFGLCGKGLGKNKMDRVYLLSSIASILEAEVRNRTGIQQICDKMLENSNTTLPVERYSNLIHFLISQKGANCFRHKFTKYVKRKREEISNNHNWMYQTCTEYGYYKTSGRSNNTFSKLVSLDYYAELCREVFNSSYTKEFIEQAVNNTNTFFGGLEINVSRLVFINGEFDPWHRLSITRKPEWSNLDIIFIKGAFHCSDIAGKTSQDSKDLKAARRKVKSLLSKWLKEER